jgi:hypothetical protein
MKILLFILLIILICIIANIIIISYCNYKNEKKGGLNENNLSKNNLTYAIIGTGEIKSYLGLDYSILRNMLENYGFKESSSKRVSVSFGIPNHKKGINVNAYNPNFYNQHSAIKNTLDRHSCFINKSELYNTIYNLIPIGIKFLPKSYTPEEFERFSDKWLPPYILKKDRIGQQLGIKIIETKEEYFKEKKSLHITNNAIISEYISNPLTIEGKKFHLRIHFILSVISGITRCYANEWHHILTAKKPYINGDWLNGDIHLTGGRTTDQRYEFPDDLTKCDIENKSIENKSIENKSIENKSIEIILKNLTECIHVITMALSMSNVKNYPESDAGYCIYGVDVLITKDFHPYIIEINTTPGYGANGFGIRNNKQKEDQFNTKISNNMFSFELDNVILPYFGLKRPNMIAQQSECIGNGILSPFGAILTGNNKCFLIPYLNATDLEINNAKQMNFYTSISFSHLLDTSNHQDIFLIAMANVILGFIGVSHNSFINIAIMEEYQNRKIATAMIAQLLDIYSSRYDPNHILRLKDNNIFLQKIATKLKFIESGRKCKIIDSILKKINNNKILTYKIIENTKSYFDLSLFTPSNSQFVHFLYETLTTNYRLTKDSTGNKHNKNFTYQGAELKSSLKLPILKNIDIFTKYVYNHDNLNFQKIFHCNTIKKSENIPFLVKDQNILRLRYFFIVYVRNNGIIHFFKFSDILAISYMDQYYNLEDKNIHTKYNFIEDFKNSDLVEYLDGVELDKYMSIIVNAIFSSKIELYSESNSGFLPITIDINFIKKSEKYIPNLYQVWNNSPIEQNEFMDETFIKKYYQWITHCVIYPHFGYPHTKMSPMLCKYTNSIVDTNSIDPTIISLLSLQFNHDRNIVSVFYMGENIEIINLNLSHIADYIIELHIKNIKMEENILFHAIFMLMDILSAYYAPYIPQLIILNLKKIHNIVYKLKFYKSNLFKEYFIRKCRI